MTGASADTRQLPYSFPISWLPMPGLPAGHPSICLIGHDAASFCFADFAANGIHCPAHIQSSVVLRQKEFFYGRLAAQRALAALGPIDATVAVGAMREPIWPAGYVGSITHSRLFAAAIAMRAETMNGVGIDIESICVLEDQMAIQEIAVCARELAYLKTLTRILPLAVLLTLVYSAKESLYKAAFPDVGRIFDFSEADATDFDFSRKTLLLTLQSNLSRNFSKGKACRISYAFIGQDTILTAFAW